MATEVKSTSKELRCFIVIGAYKDDDIWGSKVSKFLSNKSKKDMKFWLRKYEVPKEYIENDWDISEDVLSNSIYIREIENLETLELELKKYIDDLSIFDVDWKCENPI